MSRPWPVRSHANFCETNEPEKICHWDQGIGGLGKGAMPHTAVAQAGSGGVGIRLPLPCLEGVQLGSVPGLQVVQVPVNAPMSGYGVVKPSERVCRKATIWSSSVSVKPSFPTVISMLFETSGIGQQVTFSIVPVGQFPEVTLNG